MLHRVGDDTQYRRSTSKLARLGKALFETEGSFRVPSQADSCRTGLAISTSLLEQLPRRNEKGLNTRLGTAGRRLPMDWSSLIDGDYDQRDWHRKLDHTAVLLKSKQDGNVLAIMTFLPRNTI